MTRERPTNATSLAARLRNLCRDRGVPEGRARRLFAVVVVGQILARTGVGVIKGATNLEVRIGTARTRASSDLDTVRRGSLEEFRDLLAETLRTGWAGFSGVIADHGPIDTPAPAVYQPHRLRMRLSYRAGNFASIDIEVSPEETFRSPWTAMPVITATSRPPPSSCSLTATGIRGRPASPPAPDGPTATPKKPPAFGSSRTWTQQWPGLTNLVAQIDGA